MRYRRFYGPREKQLILIVAVLTVALTLSMQAVYRWLAYSSWKVGTLDWVHVPGYSVSAFVMAVERIENGSPGSLTVHAVELAGPPEVRGRHKVNEIYDLLALADAYPDQLMIMRFQVEGPLSYYQFAEFNRIAPIQDITRRYLFTEVSVFKQR
ncbi:MAG: hypothetical protein ACOX2K_08355 [Bacillota bacterium]